MFYKFEDLVPNMIEVPPESLPLFDFDYYLRGLLDTSKKNKFDPSLLFFIDNDSIQIEGHKELIESYGFNYL